MRYAQVGARGSPTSSPESRTASAVARQVTLVQHLQNTLALNSSAAEARAEALMAAGFDTPAKFDMLTPVLLLSEYGFRAGDVILLLRASVRQVAQATRSCAAAQPEGSGLGLAGRLQGGALDVPVLLPSGETHMFVVNESEPMEVIKRRIHELQTRDLPVQETPGDEKRSPDSGGSKNRRKKSRKSKKSRVKRKSKKSRVKRKTKRKRKSSSR